MPTLSRLSRRAFLPLLLLGALLVVEGCSMGGARRAAYTPSGGVSSVVLQNRTDTPIYFVYMSPCSASSWGEDQLDASEVIMPSASRTFAMTPGCWDLKARFRDGREVEERQVYMSAGGSRTWTVSY